MLLQWDMWLPHTDSFHQGAEAESLRQSCDLTPRGLRFFKMPLRLVNNTHTQKKHRVVWGSDIYGLKKKTTKKHNNPNNTTLKNVIYASLFLESDLGRKALFIGVAR